MRWLTIAPIALFAALAIGFALGLGQRPDIIPSPLIDQEAPQFTLPALPGRADGGLSKDDLIGHGPVLLNVFASWCIPCRAEHPQLMALARDHGLRIVAINYKDKPEDAAAWLKNLGDPFTKIGRDDTGRVSIDWGVYGVPESFIVDREGRIRYKHVGPMDAHDVATKILPAIRKLQT